MIIIIIIMIIIIIIIIMIIKTSKKKKYFLFVPGRYRCKNYEKEKNNYVKSECFLLVG